MYKHTSNPWESNHRDGLTGHKNAIFIYLFYSHCAGFFNATSLSTKCRRRHASSLLFPVARLKRFISCSRCCQKNMGISLGRTCELIRSSRPSVAVWNKTLSI